MMIDVVAMSDFIHGKLAMAKREEGSLPEPLAKDLQAAGLVVFVIDAGANKSAAPLINKMASVARNKAAKSTKIEPKVEGLAKIEPSVESADVCTSAASVTGEGAGSLDGASSVVVPGTSPIDVVA